MSSTSSQSGESIDSSSTDVGCKSRRKLWERLPTDVNWYGRPVVFNCNGGALDSENGSSRRGSVRSQNADAGSDMTMNRRDLSEVLPGSHGQQAELRVQNYLRSPKDSDSDLEGRVKYRHYNFMLSLSPSPSTYNHRFIDDLESHRYEMRQLADLDLHYAAIGTPDSIEAATSDTSSTSDGDGSHSCDDDQLPTMQVLSIRRSYRGGGADAVEEFSTSTSGDRSNFDTEEKFEAGHGQWAMTYPRISGLNRLWIDFASLDGICISELNLYLWIESIAAMNMHVYQVVAVSRIEIVSLD